MEKLIFLLIMALAVTGMVSASGAACLSGDYSPEEIMSEFGEDGFAVAPDTVPAMVPLDVELPAGLMAIPDYITDYAVQMKYNYNRNNKVEGTNSEFIHKFTSYNLMRPLFY